jgi:hypothetical protein
VNKAVVCEKSYWICPDQGGVLEVVVGLVENLKKQLIAVLKDPFGTVSKNSLALKWNCALRKTRIP